MPEARLARARASLLPTPWQMDTQSFGLGFISGVWFLLLVFIWAGL